jgi:MoxR-like ATPase
LLDEIDKLSGQDQLALLNLMESAQLTKTTKSESYEIQLNAWVFATANHKEDIMEPLIEYTDEEFRKIAISELRQEGIADDHLSLYIGNAVLSSF